MASSARISVAGEEESEVTPLLMPRRPRKLGPMEPKPGTQPFSCHVCNLNFSGGKALAIHMTEKHEPRWTEKDKLWLKSIMITVEDE